MSKKTKLTFFFPLRWIYFQSCTAPRPPAALLPLCSFLLETDVFVSGAFQTGKSLVACPETHVHDVTCAAFIFGVIPSKSLCRGSRVWINSQFHISDKLQGKYWSTLTRGREWGVEAGQTNPPVRQQLPPSFSLKINQNVAWKKSKDLKDKIIDTNSKQK